MPDKKESTESPENTESPKEPLHREVDIEKHKPDPTRYGDWEKGGRCTDF